MRLEVVEEEEDPDVGKELPGEAEADAEDVVVTAAAGHGAKLAVTVAVYGVRERKTGVDVDEGDR